MLQVLMIVTLLKLYTIVIFKIPVSDKKYHKNV